MNLAPAFAALFTSFLLITVPTPTVKSLFADNFSTILNAPGVVKVISIARIPALTMASAIPWPVT
ncbi:unannotated protein [freshwater metagenome]|uniref:Unannotated protein n=1 Tax=freshwater metagenome TaxID=449393 RepID=A0A6J6PL35_9ZZZZ